VSKKDYCFLMVLNFLVCFAVGYFVGKAYKHFKEVTPLTLQTEPLNLLPVPED
jgi:hypothetical protein